MAKFELFSTAWQSAQLVSVRPTFDGGFVALFENRGFFSGPNGTFGERALYSASIFEGDAKRGVDRVGSDLTVAKHSDFSSELQTPAVVALKGGGFGIYQTTRPLEGQISTTVDLYDEIGAKQETRTISGKHVEKSGEIYFSFGTSTSAIGFYDYFSDRIEVINLNTGSFNKAKPMIFLGGNLIALDAGHMIAFSQSSDFDVQVTVASPTRKDETPVYMGDFVPANGGVSASAAFSAGNVLILPGGSFESGTTRAAFTIMRPDDKILKTAFFQKTGKTMVTATTEIKGVGFAVLAIFGDSTTLESISDAQVRLYDFEGDLITTKSLTSAIGNKYNFYGDLPVLTQLERLDTESGIRLMANWTVSTVGTTASEDDQSWFGEVLEFNVALNNAGTSLADALHGFGKVDTLRGGGGDDLIRGEGGKDRLFGDAGEDKIYGGFGNDTIDGGGGNDDLRGSLGNEKIGGGSGDDKLLGEDGNDTLDGGGGNDKLIGSLGKDLLEGGDGDDALSGGDGGDKLKGEDGDDDLSGDDGQDILLGGRGNDFLDGGDGNDIVNGGDGRDLMTGGKGADLFQFSSAGDSDTGSRNDIIRDFNREELDRIDLQPIDANSKAKRDQEFTFIGKAKFSDKRGELRYENKKGDTFVYGDVNGDGDADFSIQIDGKFALLEKDFLL